MIGQERGAVAVALVARRRTRAGVVAACLLLGVLASMLTLGAVIDQPQPPSDDLLALWLLAELAALAAVGPLLLRLLGRGSVPAGVALAALAPLSGAVPAAVVALVLVVSLRARRPGVLVVVAFVAPPAIAVVALDPAEAPVLLAVQAVVTTVLVLIGLVVGSRRALRAQDLRERTLVAERARSEERARIAGEMHDSLSHHLSLIALHAGALGRRDDLPPATVRESSRLVAELSRAAHAELRAVLGVLHQGPQPTTPPPGAESLPHLLAQHRAAGAVVDAALDPRVAERAGEATSRLLHRVVRELLANASRHAPGAPVELVVTGHADRVEVVCRNPLVAGRRDDAAGAGMGLEGVGERVRLAGGRHRAGVRGAAFVVEVSVPW